MHLYLSLSCSVTQNKIILVSIHLASQIRFRGYIWLQLGRFWPIVSTDIGPVEALETLVSSLDHRLLGGSDPDSRVVELLVRLVSAVGVANLNMKVLVNRMYSWEGI